MKRLWILVMALAVGCTASTPPEPVPDLAPATWQADYDSYMEAQLVDRTSAGVATGMNGAVTVAYNGLAARAGLEALKQGGNAIDAAMTAAMAQVTLTAGAPISYFGIMSLVYYEAATGEVHTMNAEWNTVLGEDDPMSIPGGIDLTSEEGIYGTAVSGRTALVGGFMKGVGAAHERFGRLPWPQIFEPSIYIAEQGMPISAKTAGYFAARHEDLSRLPETRETLVKPDGSPYAEGDVLKQPALAATLRAVAQNGTDYMYNGPWAERAVAAIQAEGGKMTLEDLASYEVRWDTPLVAPLGEYELHSNPPPNGGGVAMIEAYNLADDVHRLPARRDARAVLPRSRDHRRVARDVRVRHRDVGAHGSRREALAVDAAGTEAFRRCRRDRLGGQHCRHHPEHQLCALGQDRDRRGRN